MMFAVLPLITVYSTRVSIHGTQLFSSPDGDILVFMVTEESLV